MKRVLVTGAGGFVGARACRFLQGNYEVLTLPKGWMASCTELQLMQSIAKAQPDVILHTAAISDTGYTEQHPEEAYRANVELPLWLARAAAQRGAKLVGFSSDQVYAGVQQPGSLSETVELSPANVYGRQKLEMEQRMLDACPDTVLLRATWMYDLPSYGLPIRGNLPLNILRAAKTGEVLRFSRNDYRGVGYVREVIENLVPAMELPGGVYNFGSECDGDMVETARCFANLLQVDVKIEESDLPRNLAMDTGKLRAHGIEFSSTWGALRVCLGDYRLGYLM